MSVFVEIPIHTPMESLWDHTQQPELHQRWDLRFTDITYLPKASPDEPQRFRYATRIGFGVAVYGDGESVARRDLADGSRTSSLRFGSGSRLSLIAAGSGYWKYEPTADGIRFLTSYDYRTRFGRLGAIVDRLVFRPLIGWATAWSFDRLRLWLEQDIPPAVSARTALLHGIARVALIVTFVYHGLVPKLLGPNADELAMMRNAGVPISNAAAAVGALGLAELALAVCLIVFWHRRWPTLATTALAVAATAGVAITSPGYLGAAFSPVTLNFGVLCLSAIDLLTLEGNPDAGRCRRDPGEADR